MFELIAFYTFAFLSLCAFLVVVMSNNILYALSALAFGMILISSFFFLLSADFLGVVQIIVYTGAVVVMYAFGMMFFDINKEIKEKFHNQFLVWCICGALALCLFIAVGNLAGFKAASNADLSTNALAHLLYKDYLIAFEAAAVMLLMAMIAGIGLGAHKAEFPQDYNVGDDLDLDSKKRSNLPLETLDVGLCGAGISQTSFTETRFSDGAKVIDIKEAKVIDSKGITESIVETISEMETKKEQ
ncbi:NADH-quinone oxidoreductase subunit J [Helicobacter saguini]|uniref:NADH-quinone oxidoreductase subunit J n=1 Tax=Helicobacter saguini TaxID=1548018 RepID=A0A347W2Q4_9HELI|nr:NADH-quinone oxidoreductase subunit J [Helicobacter saguini]MWV62555.1 NADH-quinone oxidoreductase subunit J [Helicobacter saguini]MWV66771.1 NADH-quinone oxidoreductase subunit J [Helicobacter saguini]MWV69122.1 NADH-quinone oxidoreductase subunit J [Helicobacter saguini]MWV71323.1 NADH-quinone oxidoreductase subunit J [Helicobacter saguini]TLD94167.1 NADH-quinone oxidoreductase subunit J [Helicobacter saguini]